MKIAQLKYFKTACEYKSISKAAEVLYVTQPTVTIAIKNLEEEFGVSLLNHTTNKFELTKAGEYLLSQADVVLKNIDNVEKSMHNLSSRINTIKIGIPPMIGAFLFSKLVSDYKRVYPDVEFEITESGSLSIVEEVQQGILDLGLVAVDNDDIKREIEFIKLIETEIYVAVNINHKFASKKSISLKEIGKEKIILFNKGSYQYKHLIEEFEKRKINPHIFLQSSQLVTVNQCLENNDCVAFLYHDVIPYLKDVVGIRMSKPYIVDIGIVYNKSNLLSKQAKLFIDYALKHIRA